MAAQQQQKRLSERERLSQGKEKKIRVHPFHKFVTYFSFFYPIVCLIGYVSGGFDLHYQENRIVHDDTDFFILMSAIFLGFFGAGSLWTGYQYMEK
jgi:hypothetical protein